MEFDSDDYWEWSQRLYITVSKTKQTDKLINEFLNDYLNAYESGLLYRDGHNVVQPSFHLIKFIEAIRYYTSIYGVHHVIIDIEEMSENNRKLSTNFEDHVVTLPLKTEFRFTEYFLLMEKRKYIRIFDILNKQETIDIIKYKYTISVPVDPDQIMALEENWYTYGTLCLQPKSGHIFNGKIKPKLTQNSAPFKLLEALIKEPEKKISIDDLEIHMFSKDEKSVSKQQSKTRVQDAAKRAREGLKMNEVDSSVNIFSKDGYYWLGAVPSRK